MRTFGTVDELPSGRFRARYRGPDGRRHAKVFSTKADAWAWLATQQTDLLRKAWRAPTASRKTVGDYAEDYLPQRPPREHPRPLHGLVASPPRQDMGRRAHRRGHPAAVRSWHAKAG